VPTPRSGVDKSLWDVWGVSLGVKLSKFIHQIMKTKQLFVALYEAKFFLNIKKIYLNGSHVEEYIDKAYYINETAPSASTDLHPVGVLRSSPKHPKGICQHRFAV